MFFFFFLNNKYSSFSILPPPPPPHALQSPLSSGEISTCVSRKPSEAYAGQSNEHYWHLGFVNLIQTKRNFVILEIQGERFKSTRRLV